tara:strand:+ start:1053 stop:1298 length:246 start_codon:yes stop_codon:yes gene_type:complete
MKYKNLQTFSKVMGQLLLKVANFEEFNTLLNLGGKAAFWEFEYSDEYSILYKRSNWYFSSITNGEETQELLTINVNGIPEF